MWRADMGLQKYEIISQQRATLLSCALLLISLMIHPVTISSFTNPSPILSSSSLSYASSTLYNPNRIENQQDKSVLYVSTTATATVSTFQNDNNNNNDQEENNSVIVETAAPQQLSSIAISSDTTAQVPTTTEIDDTTNQNNNNNYNKLRKELVRKEGGIFSFTTKYGGLNIFAIYYGFVAIGLGIPWYITLSIYDILQTYIFKYKIDKNRKFPSLLNHLWGVTLMRLTLMYPTMENKHILQKFYKEKRCAMFVANHASWMDIPFLGATIGWCNYKLVAKKELSKVPILGKAIRVAGNLMVDRNDKKSGLKTLKKGIEYLKDGVHLCTFPEGTRSKNGRLIDFKNGAFKMAHKAGAPIIPITIVGATFVQPPHWIFPYRTVRNNLCKVIVHEPIESIGITEIELATKVRTAMINGLPPDQRPN